MKRTMVVLAILAAMALVVGSIDMPVQVVGLSGQAFAQTEIVVGPPPPPPRQEIIITAPSPQHVWVAGYWTWNNGWQWVPGHWEVPPQRLVQRQTIWVPGQWVQRGLDWVWRPGHWE